jgi:tetratricopeptide (TPR) repeat protein
VETAADVIEDVTEIPSVGRARAKWLIEWRRDLEKKFVFDPARGVPTEVRVKAEREVDTLRFRLESELIGGAHYLRAMKQEIDASREKLQPALTQARQALAQAEKDLEITRKRNPAWLIIAALIMTSFIGLALAPSRSPVTPSSGEISREKPEAARVEEAERSLAMEYCRKGEQLSQNGDFAKAADEFRNAINIDRKSNAAYEGLGYALLRQGKYEESAKASRTALDLQNGFKPFYNLGLVYFETKNYLGARNAFERAIELRDTSSWHDEYTDAYYRLGLSLAKVGEIHEAIKELEAEPGFIKGVPINGFKLAILYLCAGRITDAEAQYRKLKYTDSALTGELYKLIKKHRKPA